MYSLISFSQTASFCVCIGLKYKNIGLVSGTYVEIVTGRKEWGAKWGRRSGGGKEAGGQDKFFDTDSLTVIAI